MKLKVLGSSGAEFPGFNLPSFLIDDCLLLDAGTIGSVLDEDAQWAIRNILITHPHLDHIRGIPFLADNIIVKNLGHSVNIVSIPEVLMIIKKNILNDVIWPDFTKIPSEKKAILKFKEIEPEKSFKVNGYKIKAVRVNHPVPAVGYIVKNSDTTLVYTGDTGVTDGIWRERGRISALIVEISFPDRMRELAMLTGHLTPSLLKEELEKLSCKPGHVFITHAKPQYYDIITRELKALKINGLSVLKNGSTYNL